MASVNKQSLREEFDTLKARFERLCTDGQMAAESRALFQAMLMLFEVLMAVFMERHTTKDNSNSSKPYSDPQGRYRHHPCGRQRQGQGTQRCSLRQHPDRRDRSGRRGH